MVLEKIQNALMLLEHCRARDLAVFSTMAIRATLAPKGQSHFLSTRFRVSIYSQQTARFSLAMDVVLNV